MAVNGQKLLPQGNRGGALAVSRPKVSLVKKEIKKDITSAPDTMLVIKTRVIEIEKILKGSVALDKKLQDQERKQREKSLRAEEEKELETKEDKDDKKVKKKKSKIKLGFLDGLIKFVNDVLMGWVLVRMIDWLPKLKKIIPILGKALDFITNTVIGAVDILGTFLMWGDKAINGSRNFTRNLFGDKGVKAFDSLISTIGTLFNVISILGLAAAAFGQEWGNQGGDPTRVKGLDVDVKRTNRRIKFQNADYLKKLKARYKQRFGKNIPDRFFKDLQVDQPRKPNLLDNLKKNVNRVSETGKTSIRNRFNQIRSGVTDAFSSAKPKGPNPLIENFKKNIKGKYTSRKSSVDNFLELAKERFSNKQNIFTGKPLKKGLSHHIEDLFARGWKGTKRIASDTTEYMVKGTKSNLGKVNRGLQRSGAWLDDKLIKPFYRNTIGKINNWIADSIKPGEILKRLSKENNILGRGTKGLLEVMNSPLARKIFGKAPLIGDIIIFVSDLLSGKHWVRALLRTLGAFGVDWGFYSLMALTAFGAPFSAGTSLSLSAAILAAYIAADAMAGAALGNDGVGQFLGDKLADALGIPEKAGEEGGGTWANLFGKGSTNSMKNVENLIKGVKLSEEQKEIISRVGGGLGDPSLLDGISKDSKNGYTTQNKEGVAKFKPIDVNSVTNGINISASYEGSNGSVVVIDNSSNGTGNNNENESELVILGGGNDDDGSADALYKGG